MKTRSFRPELLWTGDRFERERILEIGPARHRILEADAGTRADALRGKALIPGFVNAHSHAFQRALRGSSERFPDGKGSFWSWRRAMYSLVESIDAESLRAISLRAFEEMRDAGITSVGEFHYLHHGSEPWELDDAVIDAAVEAGIRIVLLQTYYERGGFDQPVEPAQARFASRSVDEFLDAFDRLRERRSEPLVSYGIVAHSLRAVSLENVKLLWEAAIERDLPFHMHIEEQRKEVEDCLQSHGATPMRLILDELAPDSRFTAVHATHTVPAEIEELASRGARVCLTPLTEANLGDGVQPLAARIASNLAIGTDSNARISMVEEMRWLEYVQRLVHEERGMFADAAGRLGAPLLRIATEGGARSLYRSADSPRDWTLIDLESPSLRGWNESNLVDVLVTAGGNSAIAGTIVAGALRESGAFRPA